MMDCYKWGDSWSSRRALHFVKKKFWFWTKKILSLLPPKKHNTFTSYNSKYLSYGKWRIVTSGVIRDQLDALYILKKEISILDKKHFWDPPKTPYIYKLQVQIAQ